MFSALILLVSLVALTQFALYAWRAAILSTAAQPVAYAVCEAAGLSSHSVAATDFQKLSSLQAMCPELQASSQELWPLTIYYRALEALDWMGEKILPTDRGWAQQEMATCSRYLAVVIGARMQRNQACLAQLRSH